MNTKVWISSTILALSAICAKVKRRRVKLYDRFKNASIWPFCFLLVKLHQADIVYVVRITIID